MYLRDLFHSAMRRWPIAVVLLIMTGGLIYYASTIIQPTYEAKASLVLIPPADPSQETPNRYLGLGGLSQSGDVLANSVMSEETAAKLTKMVPGAKYMVSPDWSTSAPILTVTADSPTAEGAQLMLQAALAQVPVNLVELQNSVGVKPANQITLIQVSRDIAPQALEKKRIRTLGMLGVGLLVIASLVLAATDGLLLRRKARRKARAKASDDDETDATSEPSAPVKLARPEKVVEVDGALTSFDASASARRRRQSASGRR